MPCKASFSIQDDLPFQLDQMQLGLPSRDYFLHLESEKDLAAYHNYMVDVAELLGANRSYAETELWAVVEFEQQLANVSQDGFKSDFVFTSPWEGWGVE